MLGPGRVGCYNQNLIAGENQVLTPTDTLLGWRAERGVAMGEYFAPLQTCGLLGCPLSRMHSGLCAPTTVAGKRVRRPNHRMLSEAQGAGSGDSTPTRPSDPSSLKRGGASAPSTPTRIRPAVASTPKSSSVPALPDELVSHIIAQADVAILPVFAVLDRQFRRLCIRRLRKLATLSRRPFCLPGAAILGRGRAEYAEVAFRVQSLQGACMSALAAAISAGALGTVESLNLTWQSIGSSGAIALADALASGSMRQLRKLWLGGNEIDDSGAIPLARALATLPALEELHLQNNRIGDGTVQAVCDLGSELDHLKYLTFGQANLVGEVGAVALAQAIADGRLASLRELVMSDTTPRFPGLDSVCKRMAIKLRWQS